MTHRELLKFIQDELERNGFTFKTRKEFFEKLLPDEDYEFYRSNLSNWFGGKPGKVTNRDFLTALQNRIGFESSVWDADNRTQLEVIRQAVKKFINPTPQVDLSELLPKNTPISDEQATLLLQIKNSPKEEADSLLLNHQSFLERTPKNQNFLLKLLTLLYDKGLYDTLAQRVFPSLLAHNTDQNHIKLFKAHTLGSLSEPDYIGAASLLETIEGSSTEEMLELQTGVISNIRRYTLEKEDLTREELDTALPVLIRYYTNVFEIQNHHYYPGVNLTYLLTLSKLTSPDSLIIDPYDLQTIYNDTQPSISRNTNSTSKETSYYAKMSEIEFRLLRDKNDTDALLANLLEIDAPSVTYVERTLRMMKFFVPTVKKFGVLDANELLDRLEGVIKILVGYVEYIKRY